jgi:hypothetical protein
MPHYQVINELPVLSFRTPVGKCKRLCIACLRKKYTNEPSRIGPEVIGACENCEEVKECAHYEARRLQPVPAKKRAKVIPVAEKFNIVRRKK